jgi:hypothetical protein
MMPYVNFTVVHLSTFAKRFIDSGKSQFDETPKTRCITIQDYVNLYTGPEADIHFRYSIIINLIFVTFTHGVALPILFPIALFTLFNFYVTERYLFAYFYKKPPLFDNEMNARALGLLQYAPVMMILFGYWHISNR